MQNILVIISGSPGAGKDFIIEKFLESKIAKEISIKKVKTHADRSMRPGESPDAYNFVSKEELDELNNNGLLAEEIVTTGFSRKATAKSEILKLFSGQSLVWRIDPTLATKIVEGKYYNEYFPDHSVELDKMTLVILIHSPQVVIETRRKARDKHKYNPKEYIARDEYEKPYLQILLNHDKVNIIKNIEGQDEITINKITEIVEKHYAKITGK